ncbi:DUF2800 domain-containing protein [Bradyrhizobium liaoningense]
MTIHTDPNSAHAIYSMSSGGRWAKEGGCTASAEAIAMLPPQESGEEAEEGTAAHTELERRLGKLNGEFVYPATMPIADVDPEHPAAYAVAMMIAFIRKLPPGRMWVEQRVALSDQIWGTSDIQHWQEETGILTTADLKNGQRAVDPDKEQLRLYGAAGMFTHKLPVKWLRYVVVQPYDWRPFVPRVKQHIESAESLHAWASRVYAIPRSPKSFTAGEHCRDCPLFGKCDASIDMLSNFGAVINGLVSPEAVRPEQVALFLSLEKPITDQVKKFKSHWEKLALKTEQPPPGMKLVTTAPHRKWIDVAAARAAVIEKCGVDALDPPTPAQAEELGVDVSKLADRPKGGPALAFDSDKRKPWRASAAEMFQNVPGVLK